MGDRDKLKERILRRAREYQKHIKLGPVPEIHTDVCGKTGKKYEVVFLDGNQLCSECGYKLGSRELVYFSGISSSL